MSNPMEIMKAGEQPTDRGTIVHPSGSISMGEDGVKRYRVITIKLGMEMEMIGMRLTRRGRAPSCFTIARKEYGLKGNKRAIYEKFCALHGLTPKAPREEATAP